VISFGLEASPHDLTFLISLFTVTPDPRSSFSFREVRLERLESICVLEEDPPSFFYDSPPVADLQKLTLPEVWYQPDLELAPSPAFFPKLTSMSESFSLMCITLLLCFTSRWMLPQVLTNKKPYSS